MATLQAKKNGAPGPIRTGDLRFRKPTLYPSELREQKANVYGTKMHILDDTLFSCSKHFANIYLAAEIGDGYMSQHELPATAKNKRKPSLPPGVYRRSGGGQQSFLVSLGRDSHGKQKWKSAKTLEEAISQRLLFEHAKKQEGESLWMLTQEQRADARAALDILKDHPSETLVAAANFYLKQHLSLARSQNLSQLVDKFIGEQAAAGVRMTTLRDLRSRLKPIKKRFGNRLASEVSVEDIKAWDGDMKKEGLAPLSRKHYLAKASSLYRWAIANKFAYSTPLDPRAVRRPKIIRGNVQFFTVEQSKRILEVFSKYGLRNYAVLGLLLGIRPEETRRLRNKNFNVDGDRIVVTLDADITKTGKRVIELPRGTPLGDSMWAWLSGNGRLELPEKIAPSLSVWRRRFKLVRKELNFKWIIDGMRHTAATFHYALSRDEGATSALLGHTTPEMLKMHYKGLTTEAEAKKFYALRPE